jgi:hypothetical protein
MSVFDETAKVGLEIKKLHKTMEMLAPCLARCGKWSYSVFKDWATRIINGERPPQFMRKKWLIEMGKLEKEKEKQCRR